MTKLTSSNISHSKGSFCVKAIAKSQDRETNLLDTSKCQSVKKQTNKQTKKLQSILLVSV